MTSSPKSPTPACTHVLPRPLESSGCLRGWILPPSLQVPCVLSHRSLGSDFLGKRKARATIVCGLGSARMVHGREDQRSVGTEVQGRGLVSGRVTGVPFTLQIHCALPWHRGGQNLGSAGSELWWWCPLEAALGTPPFSAGHLA